MEIAILLYDAMTVLDAIGPYEVLAQWPGATVRLVAERKGEVRNDTCFVGLQADHGIDEIRSADVLLVPGGPGDAAVCANPRVLDWVRAIHETTTWTTSVCTGALILGAAGLLEGRPAITHWARRDALREYGAIPTVARFVESDGIITAAGVSAGIDMALELTRRVYGDDLARMLQLALEYDPAPPFDAGSPEKAGPEATQGMLAGFEALMQQRAQTRP